MSRIMVIGARGRAGKAAVSEAVARGHEVTAVARSGGDGLVDGDVTDARRIAELAAGHDAVIASVYDSSPTFFSEASEALVDGLTKAGVERLVWVGLASILPTADGSLLMDTPGYPNEYRTFYLMHHAALDTLKASALDWVSVAPAGDFNHAAPARVGGYRVAPADASELISYADLAIALVDEVDRPRHHRSAYGVIAGQVV
jgi:putative NADH-flavin reductase